MAPRSVIASMLRAMSVAMLVLLIGVSGAARAVEPDEVLPDAGLEARARHLSGELRCLVCQNQSIDDSSAPLARDLRLLVRERLKAGDSDDSVRQYLVQRYGEFVLLKPPFTMVTLLLWLAPLLALLGGIAVVWRHVHKPAAADGQASTAATRGLTDSEEQRLSELLRKPD